MMVSLLVSAGCLLAQHRQDRAPQQVQQTFQRDYPQADNATWSHKNSQWSARFDDKSPNDNGEMVAHYSHTGKYIDSHIPYDRNDVPAAVVKTTHRRYRDARDESYTRIDQPNGLSLFQVLLNIGGNQKKVYMNEDGQERRYTDRH